MPDSLMVVDYLIGHTGSVHDSWAFRSTRTFKEHAHIFAPGEWMWADSAYPAETWCVSPFKKPVGDELTPDQRTYNYHVSKVCQCQSFLANQLLISWKVRIRSEHAIGLLKGRFQALKELRIQIDSVQRHKWAVMFVRCCIILHNLVLRIEEGDFDADYREQLYRRGRDRERMRDDSSDESSGDGEEADLRRARRRLETEGQRFRRRVMTRLFDSPSSGAVRRT